MKIGPIDVSYRMLIYAGLIAFGAVFLLTTWSSKKELRQESYYRNDILRGLYDDSPEAHSAAVDACRALLSHNPKHIHARLYLGALLMRKKETPDALKEAREIFEKLGDDAGAKPEEKAWAWVSAGVAAFNQSETGDANKAAIESEKLFLKALEADKDNADAMANLALAQMFKSGSKGVADTNAWRVKALAAKEPASLKAQAQLHNLEGMSLLESGKPLAALGAFRMARALRPKREDVADNIRMAALAGITLKELPNDERRELLKKIEADLSSYGKNESAAMIAAGRGWMMLKDSPDFMAQNGPFQSATRLLNAAVNKDPQNIQAYYSKSAVLDERVSDLSAKLVSNITGFKGETPALGLWKTSDKLYFATEDGGLLNDLRNTLTMQAELWGQFAERTPKPAEKVEAKLRQLVCLRRLIWSYPEKDAAVQTGIRDRAARVSDDLLKLDPENGAAHYAVGQHLLDKNDFGGAYRELTLAKEKKFNAEGLERLLAGLGRKPEVVDVWPNPQRRWFGARPLIGGTLKVLKGSGPLKEASLLLGKTALTPVITGSQVFYVAEDDAALDGDHEVGISVTDEFGARIEFPKFTFGMDKRPPEIKVAPDDGSAIDPKQLWTISVRDASGIDPAQTQVVLKSVKPTKITRDLVKEGKYKVSVDVQPPVKLNTLCGENFQIGPGLDLQPGEYTLEITACDINGNTGTAAKTYTVKAAK
jgi:hypothetical protein